MGKYKIGISTIKIGAIAGDGGMGTSLTVVGDTVAGTASLITEEGTKTDFKIEEADDPVYSILSEKGKITLAWSTYANDAATLEKFFGGTVTAGPPEKWAAPDSLPELEKSVEVTLKSGGKIEIVRAKLISKINWPLDKTKMAQIDITASILKPTKAATASMTVTDGA
jgi:hypothetical protein